MEKFNVVPILIFWRELLALLLVFLCRHFPSLLCVLEMNKVFVPQPKVHAFVLLPRDISASTLLVTSLCLYHTPGCELHVCVCVRMLEALILCTGIDAH